MKYYSFLNKSVRKISSLKIFIEANPTKYGDIIEDKEKENIRVHLNNSGNRLMLYFGPDAEGENEEIVQYLETIIEKVNAGKFYKNDTNSRKIIVEFRSKIREYLKKEWDKAKQGK